VDRVHRVLVRYHLLVQVLPRQVRVHRAVLHPVLAHRVQVNLAHRVHRALVVLALRVAVL